LEWSFDLQVHNTRILFSRQVDVIASSLNDAWDRIWKILSILNIPSAPSANNIYTRVEADGAAGTAGSAENNEESDTASASEVNYLNARDLNRFDADDIIENLFEEYVEMGGDGKVGIDSCLRGGIATYYEAEDPSNPSSPKRPRKVVLLKCGKGHSPADRKSHNHSMPSPAGYRTALRLFEFAERFGLPVISLVDVVGAWCSLKVQFSPAGKERLKLKLKQERPNAP
jgi:acetyl-CoA carboxylase alpha subunit